MISFLISTICVFKGSCFIYLSIYHFLACLWRGGLADRGIEPEVACTLKRIADARHDVMRRHPKLLRYAFFFPSIFTSCSQHPAVPKVLIKSELDAIFSITPHILCTDLLSSWWILRCAKHFPESGLACKHWLLNWSIASLYLPSTNRSFPKL